MFTVTGVTRDGMSYDVTVDDGPDAVRQWGTVSGSPAGIAVLDVREGERFGLSADHPSYELNRDDPRSVLVALHRLTRVGLVTGDVPDDEVTVE